METGGKVTMRPLLVDKLATIAAVAPLVVRPSMPTAGIWLLLIQFVFRLTFGVAVAMALTPPRLVTSGFYRVHLWVLLGLNTFAALAAWTQREQLQVLETPVAVLAAAAILSFVSYVGSVLWLYERRDLGRRLLVALAAAALLGAGFATPWQLDAPAAGTVWMMIDAASAGMLLGVTLTAMFLGHWYLNTPTMDLIPLRRLVLLMGAALALRGVVSGTGLAATAGQAEAFQTAWLLFVGFRWLAGLIVPAVLAVMTWYTLQVPNTQSATGILYAAVILTFLGELTSQLLSADAAYPL